MLHKSKKLLVLPICIIIALTVPSCRQNYVLRIGFLSNLTHSQALCMSIDKSFFERYNADMYVFNAGPAIMESMRAEQIDICYVGPVPAISAYVNSGGNIKIIAGVTNGGSLLVTRKGLHIEDVSELSGMTVAVPQFGNTQDIILRQLIKNAGLDSTENGGTVEIIQQDNANIKNLFLKQSIDAALVPEPWGTRLTEEADADILLDYDEIFNGNYPVAVIAVRKDYLESNREKVKSFLKEHIKVTNEINSDIFTSTDNINNALLQLTGVKLDSKILSTSFAGIKVTYNINADAIKTFVDACVEQGIVRSGINTDDLVDSSLIEEVLSESEIK